MRQTNRAVVGFRSWCLVRPVGVRSDRFVKNALDYLEDLANDGRPYLDGRAVGLIATAYGDQATMSTMQTLRSIVHALRGWPTPMGATVRTYPGLFSQDGECLDDRVRSQLELVGQQLVHGARSLASPEKATT